jgi:hypothetical protein
MKTTEKKLRYDYSELDEFLKENESGELVEGFRDLLVSYTDIVTQAANEMSSGYTNFYIHREATTMIYQLEDLFRILGNLKPNEGGNGHENK